MKRVQSDPQATTALRTDVPNDIVGVQGLQFTKVSCYTTFTAEYAQEGEDLVFHFFLPPELEEKTREPHVLRYWRRTFPAIFEPVVYTAFRAEPPRVQAAYVSDFGVNSWWFRAYGFVNRLDPEGLCTHFLEELDKALDASKEI